MDSSAKVLFGDPKRDLIRFSPDGEVCNKLSADLIEAIARYIASTEDPDCITDALETALFLGGMSNDDVAHQVEKFLPY